MLSDVPAVRVDCETTVPTESGRRIMTILSRTSEAAATSARGSARLILSSGVAVFFALATLLLGAGSDHYAIDARQVAEVIMSVTLTPVARSQRLCHQRGSPEMRRAAAKDCSGITSWT